MTSPLAVAALVSAGVAVVLGGICVAAYVRAKAFLRRAVPITGTVTGYIESTRRSQNGASRRIRVYQPVIEYVDAAGTSHRYVRQLRQRAQEWNVGDPIVVHCDPQRPDRVVLDRWPDRHGNAPLLGILAALAAMHAILFVAIR